MKTQYAKNSKVKAAAKNVVCNVNHSGNRRLTFSLGFFECGGCGQFHTQEAVLSAPLGITNSGGVARLA